jgi:hypothetical protein
VRRAPARRPIAIAALAVLAGATGVRARDTGWSISRFDAHLAIAHDGSMEVRETIDAAFTARDRHGINRDLRWRFDYDGDRVREYPIDLIGATDGSGRRYPVKTTDQGALRRFRIGDPDHTVSGRQEYRVSYRVRGVLNGFSDHDELYWNVTGTWDTSIAAATVDVAVPEEAILRVACFQGAESAHDPCTARFTPSLATFSPTRPLAAGEQMTIVVGLRKGAVIADGPILAGKPRDVTRFFDHTPALVGTSAAGMAAVIGLVGAIWWRLGRDRRYVSLTPEGAGAADEPEPLLGGRPIGLELAPPEGLRPAQIGVLIDERADTLDITATIVDLAVRGYLKITELPKAHWFGHQDWQLDRLTGDESALLPYERIVLSGLFSLHPTRKLSEVKNTFHGELVKAQRALYRDAVDRGWFPANPSTIRTAARVAGVLAAALGVWLLVVLGRSRGAGLLALPVIVGGVLVAMAASAMPRRTARGSDLARRALGFRRYIRTAEAAPQAFAERVNIFTELLPYAVMFKAVERWARAFRDIDLQKATAGWYSGSSGFDAGAFSSHLGSFSTSVSTSIASTPGGSGGSGFSGGSSGGGGGGGGGSSW